MPGQIPIPNIVDATIAGIESAHKQYQKWSGGQWLWEAPEYLITTSIALKIFNLEGNKYITLENGASDAIKDAGARGRGKLHNHIRETGRVDIVLWWANETPRAIIEVKNQINHHGQYRHDITRIEKFLRRGSDTSTLQFGLFAFYDSAMDGKQKTSNEKVDDKLKSVHEECKAILGDDFSTSLHKSKIYREKESAWAAACLLIKLIAT